MLGDPMLVINWSPLAPSISIAMIPINHPQPHRIQLHLLLYALADPSRLRMVQELSQTKEIATQAFASVRTARGSIAHHLKVLREAGLVWIRPAGNRRFVSLRRDDLEARFPGLLTAILCVPGRGQSPHTGQQL